MWETQARLKKINFRARLTTEAVENRGFHSTLLQERSTVIWGYPQGDGVFSTTNSVDNAWST